MSPVRNLDTEAYLTRSLVESGRVIRVVLNVACDEHSVPVGAWCGDLGGGRFLCGPRIAKAGVVDDPATVARYRQTEQGRRSKTQTGRAWVQ